MNEPAGEVAARPGRDRTDATVIIATRDRARLLEDTLADLARQELGGRSWELIVVDNGSTDGTSALLEGREGSLPLTILYEPEPGKNRALNRAWPHASGDLLVFTDDDVRTDPGWLRSLLEAAERWPDDNLFGGRIDPVFPDSCPAWLTAPAFPHRRWAFTTYAPRDDEGPTSETPLGPNLAIRANTMPPGGFDESIGPRGPSYAMGSEVELMLRLYRRGEQFIYVPDACVHHVLLDGHVELASSAHPRPIRSSAFHSINGADSSKPPPASPRPGSGARARGTRLPSLCTRCGATSTSSSRWE